MARTAQAPHQSAGQSNDEELMKEWRFISQENNRHSHFLFSHKLLQI
jgi:hypothetical protein